MKNFYFTLILFFCTFFASAQLNSDTLTNENVLTLIKSGLPPSLIITKIKTSVTKFDVSTNELIKLKSEGVPDEIINTMIDPKNSDAFAISNDSASIFKIWKLVSRTINGVSEVKWADILIQYFDNGTFTSIYIDLKTSEKYKSGGKFELSVDGKNITYFVENEEPYIEQIIKLTENDLETKGIVQGKEYLSFYKVEK